MKKIFLLIACFGIITLKAQKPDVSNQDKEFTEAALMANMAESKLTQLALTKGFSPAVKDLSQRLVDDNKKADDVLRKIATEKSIAIPTQLNADYQKDYSKLSDKEGEDFDKTYTDWMIDYNKKAISLYEKESKHGEHTELRAFANNTLPALNKHKDLADETCKKLKKK